MQPFLCCCRYNLVQRRAKLTGLHASGDFIWTGTKRVPNFIIFGIWFPAV
ncbi:hypothetical protein MmTuc01_3144 [Methanosarcina mazei Tuc01]|uniref:Uncharacterized protein n=1 Tax=Methanosarcina mazei Tuc01 TaxID=1236903 RepID=M1Q1G6_METMZ|nr:hypothetical protein [Methanosarcina mazei]AGF98401.1 hypothetical protein MmTuc01_3144 [Methanosarcina mazei Tuc01]